MNSWKRSFGGAIGAKAGVGIGLRAESPIAGLLQQMGGIVVEEKQSGKRR